MNSTGKRPRRSPAVAKVKLRVRLDRVLVAQGRDARARWFRTWLECWRGSADPHAAYGDTWARLLSGRWFLFPPIPPAEAVRLERFLRGVGGLEVERQ